MKRMKRTALINDISGMGKCSLVADISVLASMGIEACPFPTAVLNAQTGFEGYECRDMTEMMRRYTDGWKNMGLSFEAILTGFLMNADQAEEVIRFVREFHKEGTILLVDPVMADHGKCYANYDDALLEKMKILAAEADIITPNVTELMLLAGEKWGTGEMPDLSAGEKCMTADTPALLASYARRLLNKEGKTIIVTGIPTAADNNSPAELGNLIVRKDREEMISFPSESGSYSGTGDLFAAAVLGGVLNGRSLSEAVRRAGEFVWLAVRDAAKRNVPGNIGTDYEKYLPTL